MLLPITKGLLPASQRRKSELFIHPLLFDTIIVLESIQSSS